MRLSPSPTSIATSIANTPPTYARVNNNLKKTSRNVRFADEHSIASSTASNTASVTSSSGPSSIESQKNNVYDETLVVIERSNKELEKKLKIPEAAKQPQQPPMLVRPPRLIDTIHNNKNSLAQEVIYEVDHADFQGPVSSGSLSQNRTTSEATASLMRSSSQVQLKNQDTEGSSVAPSYPSLSDLSMADITCTSFKSITAQKLMAGLSFNSIDTLLEVNAAAEARSKLNESTETVDFGII